MQNKLFPVYDDQELQFMVRPKNSGDKGYRETVNKLHAIISELTAARQCEWGYTDVAQYFEAAGFEVFYITQGD